MKRKLMSLFLALMLLLTMLPVANAEGAEATTHSVATKDQLKAAINNAVDGDTILLTADIDYGTDHIKLSKAITLDLGGKTLTTRAIKYGLALMNDGIVVKNGKLNHAGTVAAIKVWNAKEISALEIDVTGTSSAGNAIGGIVIQENAAGVDVIKNVTIHSTSGQGIAKGIETYNCGDATEPVIGSMENVTIDAKDVGMSISALCGKATNCDIKGGTTGIEIWIKGTYSASLELVNCDVEGGTQAVYVHDEFNSNPDIVNNGSITLIADAATKFDGPVALNKVINRVEDSQVILSDIQVIHVAENTTTGVKYTDLHEALTECTSGQTVTLLMDVDLGGETWTPIASFAGNFVGNNHVISNFHIDATENRGGFFNVIEASDGLDDVKVKDLTLSNVTATVGNNRFGTLANSVKGVVHNVTVKDVTVTTKHTGAWVGGMAAFMSWPWMTNCTVENLTVDATAGADLIGGFACILQKNSNHVFDNLDVKGFTVTVSDADASGCGVGGFVAQTQRGWENPKVINSDVTGIDITATGNVDVGGFIAWPGAHTIAENCTTEGKVDVTGVTGEDSFAGGFFGNLGWNCDLGAMGHVVTDCEADVDIITKVADAGGFVGSATNSDDRSMYATFNNCVAKGDITAVEGATADIGGFFGDADRGVYNECSAEGTVTNNGTGYAGSFGGAVYDVTPEYDSRYPAGTRDYTVEEVTFDGCAGSTMALDFIGYKAEDTTISIYEAMIGDNKYPTLAEAIAAAQDGDTITLLTNIDIANETRGVLDGSYDTIYLVEGKSITIDLNGKTISGEYKEPIKGGMLVGVFSTDNGGHLTLTGDGTVDITATDKVYALLVNYEDGCSIAVENGTYKLDKASDSLIYSGTGYGENNGVHVKGGTFTLGNVGTGANGKPWIFNVGGAGDHQVIVTAGTFNANVAYQHWDEVYVPEKCFITNESNTWTVKEGAVASTSLTVLNGPYEDRRIYGYQMVEEAIDAAKDPDDVVKMLQDSTVTRDVTMVENVELNLNGKALTIAENAAVLVNGTVSVTGEGTVTGKFVLATAEATLTAPAGLAVGSSVDNKDVVYEEGVYKLVDAKPKPEPEKPSYPTYWPVVDDTTTGVVEKTEQHYTVLCRKLNVRAGAGTEFDKVGSLTRGAIVHGEDMGNGWIKIEYNGETAYISAQYAEVIDADCTKTVTVICRKLNVREGAGTRYGRVGSVKRGDELCVVTEMDGWYEVLYNGGTAYVSAAYVA